MSVSHRRPVPLPKAYRLLNHGPTVLVSAAHGGQRNIMAAAWAMPLDFEPPKVLINEINSLPGFTRISMYPKLWQAAGMTYRELVTRLIELAMEKHQARRALKISR
ncbi:D-alanine--D-alanine ligase A [compost metagenome]